MDSKIWIFMAISNRAKLEAKYRREIAKNNTAAKKKVDKKRLTDENEPQPSGSRTVQDTSAEIESESTKAIQGTSYEFETVSDVANLQMTNSKQKLSNEQSESPKRNDECVKTESSEKDGKCINAECPEKNDEYPESSDKCVNTECPEEINQCINTESREKGDECIKTKLSEATVTDSHPSPFKKRTDSMKDEQIPEPSSSTKLSSRAQPNSSLERDELFKTMNQIVFKKVIRTTRTIERVDFVREFGHEQYLHLVLTKIFSKLSGRDVSAAFCVSKSWNRILTGNNSIRRRRDSYIRHQRRRRSLFGFENWPIKRKCLSKDNRRAFGELMNTNLLINR